jgi:hypothetical protein
MLDRVRIRTLRAAGYTLEEISATVGVAKRSVQNILKEPPFKSLESAPTPASRGVGRPSTVETCLGHVERILKEEPSPRQQCCKTPPHPGNGHLRGAASTSPRPRMARSRGGLARMSHDKRVDGRLG